MKYKLKEDTVQAWRAVDITPESLPAELTPYLENQRLTFLSHSFQVVNATGVLTPQQGEYLVLNNDDIFNFRDATEFELVFCNEDGSPIGEPEEEPEIDNSLPEPEPVKEKKELDSKVKARLEARRDKK